MALVVEDGTGKDNADSYISRANADTYFTDRASPSDWTDLTDDQKDSALRYGTRYVDDNYSFVGVITKDAQTLSWPRYRACDSEGRNISSSVVPLAVVHAVCEAGISHIEEALNAAEGRKTKKEKLDVLELEYFEHANVLISRPYIDAMLRKLLKSGGGMVIMNRG